MVVRSSGALRLDSVCLLPKLGTPALGSEGRANGSHDKNGSGGGRHPCPVTGSFGEHSFNISHCTGQQYAALIAEARKESSNRVWREFGKMRGNDAPRALYKKLNRERACEQQRQRWRERP